MNRYQFEKIFTRMESEFGGIRKGMEEEHEFVLLTLETNAMFIHNKYPKCNSQRMLEACALTLFDIREYFTGELADLSNFRNEDNARLEHALLYAFDPFTNPEIVSAMEEFDTPITLEDLKGNRDICKNYYREFILCICRIKRSADMWIKELGSDGYFTFLNQFIGPNLKMDKLNFTVPAGILNWDGD